MTVLAVIICLVVIVENGLMIGEKIYDNILLIVCGDTNSGMQKQWLEPWTQILTLLKSLRNWAKNISLKQSNNKLYICKK